MINCFIIGVLIYIFIFYLLLDTFVFVLILLLSFFLNFIVSVITYDSFCRLKHVDVDSDSYDISEVNDSLICISSSSETSSHRIVIQNRNIAESRQNSRSKCCYGLDQVLKVHVRSDQKWAPFPCSRAVSCFKNGTFPSNSTPYPGITWTEKTKSLNWSAYCSFAWFLSLSNRW